MSNNFKEVFEFDEDGMIIESDPFVSTQANIVKKEEKKVATTKEQLKVEQTILDLREVFIADGYYIKTVRKGKMNYDLNLGTVLSPQYIVRNEKGEFSVAFAYFSQGIKEEFMAGFDDINSNDFFTVCAKNGYLVSARNEEKSYLKELIVDLTNYLKENSVHKVTTSQLGWDNDVFYIGDKIVSKGGLTQYILNDHKHIFEMYHLKGTREKFNKSLESFGKKGFEKHKMFYLMGVCAPLLKLTKLSGITNIFHSTKPGTGKSICAKMIALTYGSESQIIQDFTANAVFARLGEVNNLPVIIDEISDKIKDPITRKGLNDLIYYLTGGKTKARAVINGDSGMGKDFCSNLSLTSNTSAENIITNDSNAAAKFARQFEITLGSKTYSNTDMAEFADSYLLTTENYGWGIEWLKVIVDNKEVLTEQIKGYFKKYQDLLGENGFRYMANNFACATVMAQMLNQMGLKQFDADETFEFFKAEIEIIKSKSKEKTVDPLLILESFLSVNGSNTKFIKKSSIGNKLEVLNQKHENQPENYTARVNKTTGELCINSKIFNLFLAREYQVHNFNMLKVYFQEINYEEKKVKINEVGCNVNCYVFKLPMEYIIDDSTNEYLKLVETSFDEEAKKMF